MSIKGTPPVKNNSTAVLLMVVVSSLYAGTTLLAKLLAITDSTTVGLHPFQVSWGRFVFAFLCLLAFLALFPKKRPNMVGVNWKLHLARSLCGWLGISAMFAAVAQMPLAEATAISFLSPLVTMGLAVVMLNEQLGVRKIVAAGLAIGGALFILKPGTDAFQIAGLFALVAAGLLGLEGIFIKRLSDSEPALRVLIINNGIGAAIASIAVFAYWAWPTSSQWSQLVALGAIMVIGQSLYIQSMKRGDASFVIVALYLVLAFAAFYDFIVFSVVPEGMVIIGAGLIVAAALSLALQKPSND